ncbi:MAG: glycosyltransferase [Candidatus Amulumruptor caecigallinarius]|nr:glycosyltransferase [Candidatus Amulumruptor caecigallinarius]
MAEGGKKKIKVLEVAYLFDYGGIRAFIMNYLRYIDKEKFDVDIYVFGDDSSPFTEEVQRLGARIFFEPENNAKKNIPRFIRQLYHFMKEHGPYDVVHAHTNLIGAWVLIAAKLAGVPHRLSHSHTTDNFRDSLIQRSYSGLRRWIVNRLATGKLACGKLAGENMYGKGADFKVAVNGIPTEKFLTPDRANVEALRRSLSIPEGVRVYANVTRLDTQKNHLFAVEVFREIHKIDPDAIFICGGVIPDLSSTEKEVKNKIREYGLEEFCRITGPFKRVEDLYHLSDVWIYCSIFEGLPFGPIELQAAGVPVLVSDVITREIDLGLGLLHFLSLDDSPQVWARKAVSIKKEGLPLEKIKKAFAMHNFDISQNVKNLEQIYEAR